MDRYAISSNNIDRYPDLGQLTNSFSAPRPKLLGILEGKVVSDKDRIDIYELIYAIKAMSFPCLWLFLFSRYYEKNKMV